MPVGSPNKILFSPTVSLSVQGSGFGFLSLSVQGSGSGFFLFHGY